jgi:choline dehydrogenase-like flavoprotein
MQWRVSYVLHVDRIKCLTYSQVASKPEYDAFAALGNPGWDFAGLAPYFKKAEKYQPQTDNTLFPGSGRLTADKGTSGPIAVSNLW